MNTAHEKPRPTVAAFSFDKMRRVGGAMALGVDYNCVNDDGDIGVGGSYVYTHVDDDADAGRCQCKPRVFRGYIAPYMQINGTSI